MQKNELDKNVKLPLFINPENGISKLNISEDKKVELRYTVAYVGFRSGTYLVIIILYTWVNRN